MTYNVTVGSLSLADGGIQRPINSEIPGWCKGALDTDWDHIPVRLVFTDPASVDVMIWALNEVKKSMAEENGGGDD